MSCTLGDEFVEAYFRFRPDHATARGYPGYDQVPVSFDDEAVERYRRAVEGIRARLDGAGAGTPDAGAEVDRSVLASHLVIATFYTHELGWLQRNPLLYVEAGLESVESLPLRGDLDTATRRRCLIARLHGLAPLMQQMRRRVNEPEAPFHAAAMEMLAGGVEQVRETVGDTTGDRELGAALDAGAAALEAGHEHLLRVQGSVRPFEPMGEERYRTLLDGEHLLEMDMGELHALARDTVAEVERELPRVSAAERALVTPPPPPGFGREDVLAYYRREVQAMRDVVEARGLMTVPAGELEVMETPPYLQAMLPGASYLPPPMYGRSRVGRFYLRPVPEDMDEHERREYHATVVHRRLRNLVAHEVYPGHHLQFLHAAAHPSAVRKVRDNDVMIEGWALYCEKLMVDEGLFERVPSARPLRALRMRALRVIVDAGIHSGEMTLADAEDFMCVHMGEGARGYVQTEVRRYAAEPTQAMSYLVGREAVLRLREEWRERRRGKLDLRTFHDRFLAEGSIPVALIRRRMVGDLAS